LPTEAPHVNPACQALLGLLNLPLRQNRGPVVVHLLSHGRLGRTGEQLYISTPHESPHHSAECTTCSENGWDLEAWIGNLESANSPAPAVLLLLDVCYAGTVVEKQWRSQGLRGERRVWILAAAAADAYAYRGQFSVAVADVLQALALDGLGTHPAESMVETGLFVRRIRERMARIIEDRSTTLPQEIHATPAELGAEVPAFFANPNFDVEAAERLRGLRQVEPGLAEFLRELDPVLDAAHFLARATGRPPTDATIRKSLFVGREGILELLSDWVTEGGSEDASRRRLAVVTGSPGTGKSSVLGMIVCAAHPRLEGLRRLLNRRELLPAPQERFAAAHARSRDQNQIAASLAGQLGLQEPQGGWTASRFIETLDDWSQSGGSAPVLVIDAVDEARLPRDLVDLLLLPLLAAAAGGDRDERRVRCRLLVGMRPWHDQFGPLLDLGRQHTFFDLDDTPMDQLRRNLESYGTTVLSTTTETQLNRTQRAGLAETIAERLTNVSRDGAHGAGSFLLASLYYQQLVSYAEIPTGDALQVPTSLEHALNIHLTQLGRPRLRHLLTAISFAKGNGLPEELVGPITDAIAKVSGKAVEHRGSLAEDLAEVRFYLRVEQDEDGTALYRLYHEGLAEHLRSPLREPEDLR
jgi:hypothetical protein